MAKPVVREPRKVTLLTDVERLPETDVQRRRKLDNERYWANPEHFRAKQRAYWERRKDAINARRREQRLVIGGGRRGR